MIKLQTTTAQTLTPGQSLVFTGIWQTGQCKPCPAELFRNNSSSVALTANGIYEAKFSGNIGGTAAGPVQLSIQSSGNNEFTMISTTAAAGDLNNVSADVPIYNVCGLANQITITNTGTVDVNVGIGAILFIKRVA